MNPLCLWKAAALACAAAVASTCVHARVGESPAAIERRLLAPGVGKLLDPSEPDKRNSPNASKSNSTFNHAARRGAGAEPPYRKFQPLFPQGARERAYWKSAVASHLSPNDGWEVYVVYLGERSMLEAYQRVGEALNEFEIMALLGANRGSSVWRRLGDGEAPKGTMLGYTYELEDGTLRARQQGNWLLIFSTRLDEYAGERRAEEQAIQALEKERLKREQQQKAPESVAGF